MEDYLNSKKLTDQYIKEKGLKVNRRRKEKLHLAIAFGMGVALKRAERRVKKLIKASNKLLGIF